jgi:hypothetical protein
MSTKITTFSWRKKQTKSQTNVNSDKKTNMPNFALRFSRKFSFQIFLVLKTFISQGKIILLDFAL